MHVKKKKEKESGRKHMPFLTTWRPDENFSLVLSWMASVISRSEFLLSVEGWPADRLMWGSTCSLPGRIDTVGAHCHFIPRALNSCWVTAERAVILGICVPGWCWIGFQEMSVVLTKSSNLTIWRKDGQCQLFLQNLAHLQQAWHYLV